MNPRLAHITVRGNLLVLKAPYDPDFLADFKIVVPHAQREWSAGTKTWQIVDCYLSECCKITLIDLCERHYDRVIIFDEDAATTWAVAMFTELPEHLHRPAYRALSRVLHPDVGGDLESMQALAAAYAKKQIAA
jgi:hypothetical protein